jgi:transcriptional regulator with XRE-family HTH domain
MGAYEVERAGLLRSFAANLRELRTQAGYSQETLAQTARLHRTQVGHLEQGKREPGLLTLLILADTLELPLDRLVQDVPVPQQRKPSPQARRAHT